MKVGECETCHEPAVKEGMDISVNHKSDCADWEIRRRCNVVTKDLIDSGVYGKYGWSTGDPRNEDSYWEKK